MLSLLSENCTLPTTMQMGLRGLANIPVEKTSLKTKKEQRVKIPAYPPLMHSLSDAERKWIKTFGARKDNIGLVAHITPRNRQG